MSVFERSNTEYSPHIRKPYLEGEIITADSLEVGEEYIVHLVYGGQASVRPTGEKELQAAQNDANLQPFLHAIQSGKPDHSTPVPTVQLSDLPPFCIDVFKEPARIFTHGTLESLTEDTDPIGRKVHVLGIREGIVEFPDEITRNAFTPGTLIKAWCFPEDSLLHIFAINDYRIDGVDPALDLSPEPNANFYNR